MGTGTARCRAARLGVAAERGRSRPDLRYAARTYVGSGDSPAGRRSSDPSNGSWGALMKATATVITTFTVAFAVTLSGQEGAVSETAHLRRMAARFAPTEIRADLSALSM